MKQKIVPNLWFNGNAKDVAEYYVSVIIQKVSRRGWQVVPENMDELMKRPNAYAKMMQMHKIIVSEF